MKKIIALALVLVLALFVFSSCSQTAKEETAKMSITIVNKTGENVKDLTLKERIGSKKQTISEGKLANDQEITMTIETVVENGAPDLEFSYALESGNAVFDSIHTKGDKVITLTVDAEGIATANIAEK